MTWLYIHTTCSPSVQEREPSILELQSRAQVLAQSVWWREALTPPSFWLREWKKGAYPRLRSGATFPLSTLNRGVELWIASLRATRANPTALQATCEEMLMTDGSLTTSCASLTPCGLAVSSAKTSQGTLTVKSAISSQHWKKWVSALRADFSAREPLEQVKDGPGSSLWPTVTARDHRSPNSQDSQDSQDRRNLGKKRGQQLMNFIAWDLPALWSTITAAAAYGSQLTRGNERSNELLLGGQAILLSLRLDPETPNGEELSATNLALNPQFAEWLMGWPIGWTALRPLETELFPWLQHARGLVLKHASKVQINTQADLFG